MARNIGSVKIEDFEDYIQAQQNRLPELPAWEQVSERVIRILAGNAGKYQLQGTNTYICGTGKRRVLVDSGQGLSLWNERIREVLKEKDFEISCVLLTHWHGDHTGGIPFLLKAYPHLASEIYKNDPDEGQQPLTEDSIICVEGATIRCILCPGHSTDHMCFILDEENAMFTGDNVLGHGFSVHEDLPAYRASLQLMADQQCQTGYPAHGVVIRDLPAKMREYTGQLVQRENQVLKAFQKAAAASAAVVGQQQQKQQVQTQPLRPMSKVSMLTTGEIVSLIYGRVSEQIARVMEPLVVEVLWKLAGEKKVAFLIDGEGTKKWFARAKPL